MAGQALDGIRAMDFTVGAALPETLRMLAEFGAEVIEVTSNENPEFMRRLNAQFDLNMGAGHNEAYRNKKCVGIDMKTPKGRDIAIELIKKSDIVAENNRPSVMFDWGLDYENVRKVKPDIIYMSSHGWGFGGPREMYQSYGPHGPAASGLTWLWNHPHVPYPVGGMVNHPDHVSSKVYFVALLAAVDYRRRTGKGQFIDTSQIEVAAGMMGEVYLDLSVNERLQFPVGNRSPHAAPHGIYKSKGLVNYDPGMVSFAIDVSPPQGPAEDCWLVISVFTEEEWGAFCKAIGSPAWTKSPKFATVLDRLDNVEELDGLVEEWTRQRDPFEAMDILQSAGVPAGVVECSEDQIYKDEQLKHRGFIIELDHPVAGKHLYPGQPIKLSETPALPSKYAPVMGENTDEIMRDVLEMSDEEIKRLKQDKILE